MYGVDDLFLFPLIPELDVLLQADNLEKLASKAGWLLTHSPAFLKHQNHASERR